VLPRVQPSSDQPSIYSGGFEVAGVGETPAWQDNAPAFGSYWLGMRKFRATAPASNAWLEDAPYATQQLADLAARDLGAKYNAEFLVGAGDSFNWLGVCNTPGIGSTDLTGTTAHTISDTTSTGTAAGSVLSWRTLKNSLPPQYQPGASVLFSPSVKQAFENLVDEVARPVFVWRRDANGDQLFDEVPYHQSQWMLANFGPGVAAAYGDWKQAYTIGQRADLSLALLTETFADRDQTGVVIIARSGGAVSNVDAVRLGTLS